jgi:hypothetical protein
MMHPLLRAPLRRPSATALHALVRHGPEELPLPQATPSDASLRQGAVSARQRGARVPGVSVEVD